MAELRWTLSLAFKLLKTHLHYHSVYGHLTWQKGDLQWGVPIYKVTWTFSHVVMQDHVIISKFYASITVMPETTKHSNMVT